MEWVMLTSKQEPRELVSKILPNKKHEMTVRYNQANYPIVSIGFLDESFLDDLEDEELQEFKSQITEKSKSKNNSKEKQEEYKFLLKETERIIKSRELDKKTIRLIYEHDYEEGVRIFEESPIFTIKENVEKWKKNHNEYFKEQ